MAFQGDGTAALTAAWIGPTTSIPMNFMYWVNQHVISSQTHMILYNSSTPTHFLRMYYSSSGGGIRAQSGDGTNSQATASGLTAGTWNFVIGRFLSNGTRRITVLKEDGSITQSSQSTAKTPTGLNTINIGVDETGAGEFFDGYIGEVAFFDDDIFGNQAANLPADLVLKAAYEGPLSLDWMLPHLIEYRVFRQGFVGPGAFDEARAGVYGRLHNYSAIGTPQVGKNPPLPAGYTKLNGVIRPLIV